MIKVIKHGHAPYRMTCQNCECTFSFEDEDIQINGDQRDYYEYIFCPECNTKRIIKSLSEYRNFQSVDTKTFNYWGWNK